MIVLYVLRSESSGKRYVGITKSLQRRLGEHASRSTKAGQILGSAEVIYTESFADYKSARLREKYLKSGKGRQWLNNMFGSRLARGE